MNTHLNPSQLVSLPERAWVYWKNPEGVYLGCNTLMANSLKIARDDIVGLTDFDLPFKKEEAHHFRASDKITLERKIPQQIHDQASLDSRHIQFLALKMPWFSEDNCQFMKHIPC